jgi:hypothetical protein
MRTWLLIFLVVIAVPNVARAQAACVGTTPTAAIFPDNKFRICSPAAATGLHVIATYDAGNGLGIQTEIRHLGADLKWHDGNAPGTLIVSIAAGTAFDGEVLKACGPGAMTAFAANAAGESGGAVVTTATFLACNPVLRPGTP